MTSPEPSTASGLAEPPLNSWKIARCGLPITCVSTLRRPRCGMPTTMSWTPSAPPRLMICSSAGISDSAPSRPKRLVPVNLRSQNFSKPSASISFLRIARLPSRVKVISLSGPSMRSCIQAFCAAFGDVHVLDAERLAVGALADRDDLAHGARIRGRARGRGRSGGRSRPRRSRRCADRVPRGRAAARCRADRGWRGDGRACGRRGSASGRAPNRASPDGRRPPRSRRPWPGALAASLAPTAFSTCAQLPSSAEVRSSLRRQRPIVAAPGGAFGVLADVGRRVLQALEEVLPLGVDRAGVLLVAGIEVVDIGGVGALKNEERAKAAFASWRDMVASW